MIVSTSVKFIEVQILFKEESTHILINMKDKKYSHFIYLFLQKN